MAPQQCCFLFTDTKLTSLLFAQAFELGMHALALKLNEPIIILAPADQPAHPEAT
jgi:hypothetical protein